MLYVPEDVRKGMFAREVLNPKQKQAIAHVLESSGIRPTRPRLIVAHCLFGETHRRVTPDELYREVTERRFYISLATVYNCLNLFANNGLLRKYSITGEKTYFDTDISGHQLFYCSDDDAIMSFSTPALELKKQPEIPQGFCIDKIDIIIHLKNVT